MFGKAFKFKRTTVITIGLLAFLVGLGFARLNTMLSNGLLFVAGLIFIVTILRLKVQAILGVLLFGFVLGW